MPEYVAVHVQVARGRVFHRRKKGREGDAHEDCLDHLHVRRGVERHGLRLPVTLVTTTDSSGALSSRRRRKVVSLGSPRSSRHLSSSFLPWIHMSTPVRV